MGEPIFPFMGSGLSLRVLDDADYERARRVLQKAKLGLEGSGE